VSLSDLHDGAAGTPPQALKQLGSALHARAPSRGASGHARVNYFKLILNGDRLRRLDWDITRVENALDCTLWQPCGRDCRGLCLVDPRHALAGR
jgi:hypothetical protein